MPPAKRILLVDDDAPFRRSLAEHLSAEDGFQTMEAGSCAEGLATLSAERIDLVLLDVGLPDGDGREACRKIRDGGAAMPIIMLTGADSEVDTIQGLESGANDYVVKPFRLGELLARVRAQLRIAEQSEAAVFSIGPYEFRPLARLLVEQTTRKKIRLTDKEAAILRYLYRAGAAVPREELLAEVWGYNAGVTTHTLETHVYRLRQKIEPVAGEARLILTAPNGYRLHP
jgi:DNA-binding response OmpR family regulator